MFRPHHCYLSPAYKTLFCAFLVLCGIIFGNTLVRAQSEYEEGYIITNKGDTLRGKVKYGRKYERSLRCIFIQKGGDDVPVRFAPFTIKGYYVHGESYDSRIYDYAPELPDGFGVFMQRILDGPCKIYYYWNTDKEMGFTMTFLDKLGKDMQEVDFLRLDEQLSEYFKDFPQLSAKIKRHAFKHSELATIVQEYNHWKIKGY